jgi:NAD(P)-dependent dehydrogenase (short-subunit alcohol dehydrogenase family)
MTTRVSPRLLLAIGASAAVALALLARRGLGKKYRTHARGVVAITGCSSGIGRHAAETLAACGYIVFAGVRKDTDFDAVLALRRSNLRPWMVDVTDHTSCLEAIATLQLAMAEEDLPLVALVNNAGVSRLAACQHHALSDIRTMFETNLFGAIDLTQLALPLLRESQGRVVMMSSIFGKYGKISLTATAYSFKL